MPMRDPYPLGFRVDEAGRIAEELEACPACGSTSVNCPLSLRTRCPYDEPTNKHDADCLRRREDPRRRYLCSCGLSDDDLRSLLLEHPAREVGGDE